MKTVGLAMLALIACLLGGSLPDARAAGQAGYIYTFAGGGVGDGGNAADAVIPYPWSVAAGPDGSVYASTIGDCRVRRILAGLISTAVGTGYCQYAGDGGDATQASLRSPWAVVASLNGDLTIADTYSCRVRRVHNGTITTIAGNGTCASAGDGQLATDASVVPHAVAVDETGAVFVADSGACTVRKIEGGIITRFAGNGACAYGGDGGSAIDAYIDDVFAIAAFDGVVYFSTMDCRVRRVVAGIIDTFAGVGTSCSSSGDGGPPQNASLWPYGLYADASGLLVADAAACRIRLIAGGVIQTIAGTNSCESGPDGGTALETSLFAPTGVTRAPNGDLLIAERDGCRILRIDEQSIVHTEGGNGTCTFYGDGLPAADAALSPASVAIGKNGTLLISDQSNCRIRQVADGTISTLYGDGTCNSAGDGGPAALATFLWPIAIDQGPNGEVYVGDQGPCRIRGTTAGTIDTVATGGCFGFDVDDAGNLYYSESCRIWKRTPEGITTPVAGTGVCGLDGDDGPALQARITAGHGLKVDGEGAIYISEGNQCRVRKVSNGIITTIAGAGSPPQCYQFGGEGGLAKEATIGYATDIELDPAGNLYISALNACHILRVKHGIVRRIAGNGDCQELGDNGPATLASLAGDYHIAVDADFRVYTAGFTRVRVIEPDDADADGVIGALDNCELVANPTQQNTDANFTDNTPPASQDDRTHPNSDGAGDACDTDDDNDGLTDADEASGGACAGHATDPLLRDTDGDRVLDGPECALGADPTSAASKPTPAQCGPTTDGDGDRLSARAEYCAYGTSDANTDTDGDRTLDGAKDGCEAASVNTDRVVNSGDQLLMVIEILREPTPSARLVSYDVNKDGAVNAGDQLLIAQFISPSGQCP